MIEANTIQPEGLFIPLSVLRPYLDASEADERVISSSLRTLHENYKTANYQNALVVGRFQPPHRGHIYLIEAGLEIAHNVIIGIGSANKNDERNPFKPSQREYWIREELKRKKIDPTRVRFVYLNDVGNNDKWRDATLLQTQKLCESGRPDVVIGNSNWVNSIFEEIGIPAVRPPEINRYHNQSSRIRKEFILSA